MNCKSCGAAILWATTEGGKNMPLDAKPEKRVLLVPRSDGLPSKPLARVVDVYTSHFVSCPQADEHRRAR